MRATASNVTVGTKLILVRNPTTEWPKGRVVSITNISKFAYYYGPLPTDNFSAGFLGDFDLFEEDTYLVVCPERGFNCVVTRHEVVEILSKYVDEINKFKIVKNPNFVNFKVNFTVELVD